MISSCRSPGRWPRPGPWSRFDLPGNGESDNVLGTHSPTSAIYAGVVADALDSLGIDEVDIVGRYSGGPIGMELTFQRPGLVRHLVQAGITAYEPDEARALLARYTPSIPPRDDGGHVLTAWHIMESQALYWPWFDQSRDAVIAGEPQLDAQLIHQRVFDLLRCGDVYQQAYAALWTYPLRERLPRLTVPSLLCAPRWDPLFPHLGKAAASGAAMPVRDAAGQVRGLASRPAALLRPALTAASTRRVGCAQTMARALPGQRCVRRCVRGMGLATAVCIGRRDGMWGESGANGSLTGGRSRRANPSAGRPTGTSMN